MSASLTALPHVYLLTSDEGLWERVSATLAEAGLSPRRAPDRTVAAAPPRSGALLVDGRTQDVDEILVWLRQTAGTRATLPLLVLVDTPPPKDRLLYWIGGGAWDVVRLPLEEEAMTFRLRNLLRPATELASAQERPSTPYHWRVLLSAAEETLSLARRYGRATSCIALTLRAVDDAGAPDHALVERVGRFALDWTRRSDLVGTDGEGHVLILLPDTAVEGAMILFQRLARALVDQMHAWDVEATVEGRVIQDDREDGAEQLFAAALTAPTVAPDSARRF